jgi:hypothetical protein
MSLDCAWVKHKQMCLKEGKNRSKHRLFLCSVERMCAEGHCEWTQGNHPRDAQDDRTLQERLLGVCTLHATETHRFCTSYFEGELVGLIDRLEWIVYRPNVCSPHTKGWSPHEWN